MRRRTPNAIKRRCSKSKGERKIWAEEVDIEHNTGSKIKATKSEVTTSTDFDSIMEIVR